MAFYIHFALALNFFLTAAASQIQTVANEQWQSLNRTVGGRLRRGVPIAKPCYSKYNGSLTAPNPIECAAVQAGYTDDLTVTSYFGGMLTANWGTCQAKAQGCNLDYLAPINPIGFFAPPNNCYQGSIAPYYIDVRKPEDIKAAFEFSRQTRVPISVKNAGHDYKGRSMVPNSLGLWIQNLRPPIQLNKVFKAAGCSTSYQAITFGGGQDFNGVYDFSEANSITVPGGSSRTVRPAGGWIAGAGHSPLSPKFGLGVDNVLELKAVLPTGEFITASRCQNQDLFFALRGGGGGTFGVVTEMTTRAYPKQPLQVLYFTFASLDPTAIEKFIRVLVESQTKWSADHWGGYIQPGVYSKLTSGMILMTPSLSFEEAVVSMKPLFDLALELGLIPPVIVPTESYPAAFRRFLLPNDEPVDVSLALGSRLIPRANFATAAARDELTAAMVNVSRKVVYEPGPDHPDPRVIGYGAPFQIFVTTPAGYEGSGNDSAIAPAWRKALWQTFIAPTFANNAPVDEIQRIFRMAHEAADILRRITPDSGAYQNEADIYEPDPIRSFWGEENYSKLLQIKKRVDPDNLLTCWGCIGWEGPTAERYQCYPKLG